MIKLRAPVGPHQDNLSDDVRLVQTLLNLALRPQPALTPDGRFGPMTGQAIVAFQHKPGVTPSADGIISPNGQTFLKLRSYHQAAGSHKIPEHVQAFIATILPSARKANESWGVPISVLIAQSAQETGWGVHVTDNAYFGIKGKSPSGDSTTFTTHEVVNGKSVKIDDSFRAYKDIDEAADDYGRFLAENPRYDGCFLYKDKPEKFVAALAAAGYATDPLYATKLLNIIRHYNLTEYDKKP